MIQNKKLSITIHDAQFAKDFQYCIAVQFQSQKKITDVSAISRNPVFTNNTLVFDLSSNHTIKSSIMFIVNICAQQNEPTYSKQTNYNNSSLVNNNDSVFLKNKGNNIKILGESSLDLTPFGLQPSQDYNLPIRQQIKFLRVKQGREVTVGRCLVSLKIVPEDQVPVYLEQLQTKKIERNQFYNQLPDYDQDTSSFRWRIKTEVRYANNIPIQNQGVMPQVSVQVGWTQYKGTMPQENRIFSTSILSSIHPQWNQTILIVNPSHIEKIKGSAMILLKDNNSLEDLVRVYIPLESMGFFIPYNLKLIQPAGNSQSQSSIAPIELYFSITLEAPQNHRQKLFDIIISDIIFEPLIAPFQSMHLALLSAGQEYSSDPSIQFYPFNVNEDSIQRILEFDQSRQFTYFLSQAMKVPPIKSSRQYRAATIMTIPQSFFRKELVFFLVGKIQNSVNGNSSQRNFNTSFRYKICGSTDPIQKDLVMLLVQKVKKQLFVSVRANPDIKMGKCQIQISEKEESKLNKGNQSLQGSRTSSRRGQQTATEKIMKDLNINFQSNESFFRHLTQNNEIIARILRQLDDKSESLKQAASQISDLRGKVKLLQNQNSILRRKAMADEDELVSLVQRQIETMSVRDLKDKIVKISQLYKGQRLKNKELDKAIKVMEPQVSNTMQLNSIISNQKNTIQALGQRIQKAKKDIDRINVYKDTIKKQEKVIQKLQRVMKQGMNEVRNAKQMRLELQQLKKRGGQSYQPHGNNRQIIQQKQQIQRLQRIIGQLQSSKPIASLNISNVSGGGQYQLEFKLHQAETRIEYLQQELQGRAKQHARQLAMMKMKLAQKQAILDGYSH